MEQYSAFEIANPLSTKKFLKKAISAVIGYFISAVIVAFALGLLWTAFSSGNGPTLPTSVLIPRWIGIFLVVFIVPLILNLFYIKAYIKRYYYDAGDNFITIKKGVFAPTEIHVQYSKIQDVYVDQDIWDRILGLYDVHIASATATSGIEAHIDGVEKSIAENIKNTFFSRITSNQPQTISAVQSHSQSSGEAVTLSEDVSSQTYPMSKKFFVGKFLSAFFSTFIIILVFATRIPLPLYAIPVIIILFFAIDLVGSVIWFKNFSFVFEKDMIVLKTKVISVSETHLPYHTIQDVVLTQGVIGRLLGIATVTIQNATSSSVPSGRGFAPTGVTLICQPIDQAQKLVAIVRGIIEKTKTSSTGL
jgi:uncharacterized membrane protein YdbT with pleckstrin-like domain